MTSFDSFETWAILLQLFIIAVAMIVGNVVRRKVGFLNRSLVPTALIAGLLIFIMKAMPSFNSMIDRSFMETVTYHALAFGFIAMSLRSKRKRQHKSAAGVVDSGLLTVGTYLIQAIVGLAVSLALYLLFRGSMSDQNFYASGLLLPMGYGQGPGQALNFGSIFQMVSQEQGITFHGKDFGLSVAAIGFMVGSVVGVIYLNILRLKGKIKLEERYKEEYSLSEYDNGNELPHSESVDKLSVVVCIILFTYFLVYLLMTYIGCMDLGTFGEKTIKPLVYGFNFLWGILFASLVKSVIQLLRKQGLMHREYLNDYLLNRCGGFAFDIMIVAGTAAISFENLKAIWIPLSIMCLVGAVITFVYVRWVSKEIYKGYEYQGFFAMFGMLTGTASNGMILLREIDSKYETPAAENLVLQSIPAMLFGFPMLLLIGFAPHSLKSTIITFAIFVLMAAVFTLILFRRRLFQKNDKQSLTS